MSTKIFKEETHRIIERATRNKYTREIIERGLADSNAGLTKDVSEIRAKYGLYEGK